MINILHLRDTDRVCGPGKTILETANATNKSEFTIFVGLFLLERERHNAYLNAAVERGVNVIPLIARHQFDPFLLRTLVRAIDQYNIHVIHSHEYKSDILTWLVSRRRRIPIMTTAHGWITNRWKSKLYVRLGQTVLPSFDRVVAVSEGMRRGLLACGVRDDRIAVIHNAIVTENYEPTAHRRGFLRGRGGVPDEAVLIGNIGRLSPEKGQRDFLEAAAAVARDHANAFFVLVGDGPDRRDLEELARASGIRERVIFTGHLHDVRPLYADLDILALTSHTEGFPNVVLEALCMNTPVLATDVGGTGEIIRDGQTGVLVQPHAPDAIARGLRFLIEQPDEARRLTAAGRQVVFQRFRFGDRVAKEEAIYRELIGATALPGVAT